MLRDVGLTEQGKAALRQAGAAAWRSGPAAARRLRLEKAAPEDDPWLDEEEKRQLRMALVATAE